MEPVGVFDSNKGNIGELLIGPCEGDAPFRGAAIGVDGIFLRAVQSVVTERMKGQQVFFRGMMKDHESFLGFVETDVAQTRVPEGDALYFHEQELHASSPCPSHSRLPFQGREADDFP